MIPPSVGPAGQQDNGEGRQWNVLELFAGIGGLGLGLERAGMTIVGQVEIDDFCRRVLAKHWPDVPRHDDVRTCVEWWRSEPRPRVDLVAGGFPCQPVSQAGRKLAQADPRWLWPAMAGVVHELQPEWVIAENVPGLRWRGLDDVLRDLAELGYRARAGQLSACAMGAPHSRQRLFVLAHSAGAGCRARRADRGEAARVAGPRPVGPEPDRRDWWADDPRGVDRRRALGNAVVPQVSEWIGRLLLSSEGRAA